MGCDIHEHYEVWSGTVWKHVPVWPAIDWENLTQEEEATAFKAMDDHPAILWRNYALFSILANVRNTFGIAPTSLPRGVPSDLSEPVRLEYEIYEEP